MKQTSKLLKPAVRLHAVGRCAGRIAACVAAVAIHHLWFGIGTRGVPIAIADGMVMAALCMTMGWVWKKTSAPTGQAQQQGGGQTP
jgi:hypothetical protein